MLVIGMTTYIVISDKSVSMAEILIVKGILYKHNNTIKLTEDPALMVQG